jgi:hypothetical protein
MRPTTRRQTTQVRLERAPAARHAPEGLQHKQVARVLPFAEAVAQRVWRGQAPHKWLVRQQRMGRGAWIMVSSEIVSHHGRLEGVYATASAQCDSAYGVR